MNTEERLTESDQLVKMAVIVAKEVLTFDEAATFTGLSKSYLYKLTSGQKNQRRGSLIRSSIRIP